MYHSDRRMNRTRVIITVVAAAAVISHPNVERCSYARKGFGIELFTADQTDLAQKFPASIRGLVTRSAAWYCMFCDISLEIRRYGGK